MIAVDAMGGDFAPREVFLGAIRAFEKGVPVTLFGNEAQLRDLIQRYASSAQALPPIVYTQDDIGMGDEPVSAVLRKKSSSIVQGVKSLKTGQCSAFFSAGNTGAIMVAAFTQLGCRSGVDRPAVIGRIPCGPNSYCLMLDLGANVDCKPKYLFQFAQMAYEEWCKLSGAMAPSIALLSNGAEASKGSLVVKEARKIIEKSWLSPYFYGNVEPHDVLTGAAQIIVCDGFVGNIFLKTLEACIPSNGFGRSLNTGGAFLLGVNGTVCIAHGNSCAETVEKALHTIWSTVRPDGYGGA